LIPVICCQPLTKICIIKANIPILFCMQTVTCKVMLGIKKKRVNFASLSESGRLPLHFNIVKSMIQYCYRLENLNTVSIVLHNEGNILVLLF
jgi:hypothetical protein